MRHRRPPSRRARWAAALAAAGFGVLPALGAGAAPSPGRAQDGPEPVLVAQTPTVAAGGAFEVRLDPASLPADGAVQLVLHGRVRSRSELEASMDGEGLRSTVYQVAKTVAELPTAPDGSRVLGITLDPAAPQGINLGASGVYPLEITTRDGAGADIGRIVTHLVLEPAADDESPPLAVAVVARIPDEPALRADGTVVLDDDEVEDATAWASAVAASGAKVTLAIAPERVDAIAGSGPTGTELLAQLQAIAADGSVLLRPYAASSPDALVDAGLEGELGLHLLAGAATLREHLGATPAGASWLAGSDLSEEGAALLGRVGVRQVVVQDDQVEPLRSGLIRLSLAQPFVLDGTDDGGREPLEALALDTAVVSRLDTGAEAALEASHVLAELAMLWFEQPGVPRAVVLPVDPDVDADVVTALLAGLQGSRALEAVTLDEAFERTDPLLQPGGGRVDRALVAEDPAPIADAVQDGLPAARALLDSFRALVGDGSEAVQRATAHLLLATSSALREDDQAAHLDAARAAVAGVTDLVTAPARETVTLTAREGTVPLTLRNTSGQPIEVSVRLRSAKLEFPDGDVIPLTLTEETTRLDIAVRARASGSLPLEVEVTSPDGGLVLARTEYSIRSTAVSGAGVVLSAGAAVFLMVWWARHWHRTRRSAKLMEAKHLSHPAGRPRAEDAAAGQ